MAEQDQNSVNTKAFIFQGETDNKQKIKYAVADKADRKIEQESKSPARVDTAFHRRVKGASERR